MNFLKLIALSVMFYALCSVAVQGQSASSSRAAADRPAPPSASAGQALTAAELAKVKSVLAPYKPANLTTEDAKLIKRTLRDAGLRKSRELDAAIVSLGFSPEKLDQLDPPPPPPAVGGSSAPLAKK